jgi:hypothetical protein
VPASRRDPDAVFGIQLRWPMSRRQKPPGQSMQSTAR